MSRTVRKIGKLVAMLAAVLLPAIAAAAQPERIVAVGDLHGDYAAWSRIARAAELVDQSGRWAGGNTVLVQTGDVIDRGPESTRLIHELMRLQKEAKRAGGKVIALVGNHEAMNVTDDLRYVVAADYAAFETPGSAQLRDSLYRANEKSIRAEYRARDSNLSSTAIRDAWIAATPLGLIEHQRAWHPGGAIGRWVVSNPAVVQIGGTLFVHGGIAVKYAVLSIREINRRVANALETRETGDAAIINDPDGPLWYRGLIPGAGSVAGELQEVLKAYRARRMVIGHTPNLAGIAISDDGALIRIDTGISTAYGGTPSYLEIRGEAVTAHTVSRNPTEGEDK